MNTIFVDEMNLKSVQQGAPACVIALGFFDGVHIGHQRVVAEARAEADRRGLPLALMSFRTHPINILSDGQRQVDNLMTLCTKQEKLARLGVDLFYLVDFTKTLANLTPYEFVKQYLVKLGVCHAVAGFDYCFGKMGIGKLLDIPQYATGQIAVTEVACVDYEQEKISSTAIRNRLRQGRVHEIPPFLGHHYCSKASIMDQQLDILEDTMLPISGRYVARLTQQQYQVTTELYIDNHRKVHCTQRLPLRGDVSIEWLRHNEVFQVQNII